MGKLLRVNMSEARAGFEDAGEYAFYGGRGLTSRLVGREVPPTCHALSAKNKLVVAPGLLSGSSCPNAGRLSVGAKSPLTGGIKEANVGGTASARLGRLGIKAVVVEGRAERGKLYLLLVNQDGAELVAADEYRGLSNYALADKLKAKYGDKATIMSIGPAGEMMLKAATVAVTDTKGYPSRHAGRGGLGAVMGSKGLKAIVIDDKGAEGVDYADAEAFKAAAAEFRDLLAKHPVTKSGGGLSLFGTNVNLNIINAAGALPTRNFSAGQFEGAAKIGGEALRDALTKRGGAAGHAACTGCVIHCSNIFNDADGNYVTSGLEYETVWANGANCGVDDLDSIAQIDRLCDDFGVDTMEVGCAVAVAMAAGIKNFGDAAGAVELVQEIGKGSAMGRVIGSGAATAGEVFGVERVPVVKRQALAAYDPRSVKGIGVTYATSPMGADHTAGYAVAANVMRMGGYVPPLQKEGQVELSIKTQLEAAMFDAHGICTFASFAVMSGPEAMGVIPKMQSALTGRQVTLDDVMDQAREIIRTERAFNTAAGFTREDDRLPDFFRDEPLAPHNSVFDVPDEELDRTHDI
jgi:aldehyde:ferredoxin oxidoreductase